MSDVQWNRLSVDNWEDLPVCGRDQQGLLGFGGQAGYYRDQETELYLMGGGGKGRYYDPASGRFNSADRLGYDAGDVNLYRYVGNDPLNAIDPSGNVQEPEEERRVTITRALIIELLRSSDQPEEARVTTARELKELLRPSDQPVNDFEQIRKQADLRFPVQQNCIPYALPDWARAERARSMQRTLELEKAKERQRKEDEKQRRLDAKQALADANLLIKAGKVPKAAVGILNPDGSTATVRNRPGEMVPMYDSAIAFAVPDGGNTRFGDINNAKNYFPHEERYAVEREFQNITANREFASKGLLEATLDIGQSILDFAGAAPLIGEAFDFASGLIYSARGKYSEASLSFLGMLGIGEALKWAGKTTKTARESAEFSAKTSGVGSDSFFTQWGDTTLSAKPNGTVLDDGINFSANPTNDRVDVFIDSLGELVNNAPKGAAALEQPRNALGRFMSRSRPGQAIPGSSAVDDFAAQAQRSGYDVVGREVTVNTPFGARRYDAVVRDRATGAITGVEIKSSQRAFTRFDEPARQQFAADRWLRAQGGLEAVGQNRGLFIEDAIKILWEVP